MTQTPAGALARRDHAGQRLRRPGVQIEGARVGLTHVSGLGQACGIYILERSAA